MTLSVGLHSPTVARALIFTHEGREHASVAFRDEYRAEVTIYTTAAAAQAIADAFNAAMQPAMREAAE